MESIPVQARSEPIRRDLINETYVTDCVDERQRFCKKPRAGHPNVAFNEWLAAALLQALGFPVLDFGVVRWKDELYFACEFIEEGNYYKGPLSYDSEDFQMCENASDVLYEAVAFDAWVMNPDRHHNNILVVDRGLSSRAFLIDHDRAILHMRRTVDDLRNLADEYIDGWEPDNTAWLREDPRGTWRGGIANWAKLMSKADAVKSLPESSIRDALGQLPSAWKTPELANAAEYFLLKRKEHIVEIISARRERFPNLVDGGQG